MSNTINLEADALDLTEIEVLFYEPDYTYLIELGSFLADNFTNTNQWFKLNQIDIQKCIDALLAVFYFDNLREYYTRFFPSFDPLVLDAIKLNIHLPMFLRDVIREYCRPVLFGAAVCIPVPKSATIDLMKSPYDAFDINVQTIARWNALWTQHMKGYASSLVHLEREVLKPARLMIYSKQYDLIYSTSNKFNDWRYDSFSILKHIRFNSAFEEDMANVIEKKDMDKKFRKSLIAGVNGAPIGDDGMAIIPFANKNYKIPFFTFLAVQVDGTRKINGINYFINKPFVIPSGFLLPDSRFPNKQRPSGKPGNTNAMSKNQKPKGSKGKKTKNKSKDKNTKEVSDQVDDKD